MKTARSVFAMVGTLAFVAFGCSSSDSGSGGAGGSGSGAGGSGAGAPSSGGMDCNAWCAKAQTDCPAVYTSDCVASCESDKTKPCATEQAAYDECLLSNPSVTCAGGSPNTSECLSEQQAALRCRLPDAGF